MHIRRTAKGSSLFITDVTSPGSVTNKTYLAGTTPVDYVLVTADCDSDNITVHFDLHAPDEGSYTPVATVGVVTATLTHVSGRDYTGEVVLDGSGDLDVVVVTNDGGRSNVLDYTRSLDPPLVLTGAFTTHSTNIGGDPNCPYDQTEVKQGDTIQVTGTVEGHATHVYLVNWGIVNQIWGPYVVSAFSTFNFEEPIVDGGINASGRVQIYAVNGIGNTPGATFNTTNTINQCQTAPTIPTPSMAYPLSQGAIKITEQATSTCAITNVGAFPTYAYSAPTGQVTPVNQDYTVNKIWTYATGSYNISANNARITCTRGENGKQTVRNFVIKVVNVAASISISQPGYAKWRTARNDDVGGIPVSKGTPIPKNYTMRATATQQLYAAPDITVGVGSLGSFSGGPTVWDATITITEGTDINGTYLCTLVSAQGLSAIAATLNIANDEVIVGGFESRTVYFDAFTKYSELGTDVDIVGNLTAEYVDPSQNLDFVAAIGDGGADCGEYSVSTNSGTVYDAHGEEGYLRDWALAGANTTGTLGVIIEETQS